METCGVWWAENRAGRASGCFDMHYYPRHIGDYAKDTGHLTLLEHGVYTVLLDWAYSQEKPLPDDFTTICRLCRATTGKEKAAVRRVVDEFFPLKDGGRSNNRANLEIFAFNIKSAKNAASATSRWQKGRNANALPAEGGGTTTGARVPAAIPQDPATNSQQPLLPPEIPSVAEVRTWAQMAGVCPDYAEHQHGKTTEDATWLRAGKIADWRKRWLGFWLTDRESWFKQKKAARPGEGEPPAPRMQKIPLAQMRVEL